jgi:hypothetical protein
LPLDVARELKGEDLSDEEDGRFFITTHAGGGTKDEDAWEPLI